MWLYLFFWILFAVAKLLGGPSPIIRHLGLLEGEPPQLVDLPTIVAKYLLAGMILQVHLKTWDAKTYPCQYNNDWLKLPIAYRLSLMVIF